MVVVRKHVTESFTTLDSTCGSDSAISSLAPKTDSVLIISICNRSCSSNHLQLLKLEDFNSFKNAYNRKFELGKRRP